MIECGGGEDRKEALTRRARQTECKKEGKKERCSEAHEDRGGSAGSQVQGPKPARGEAGETEADRYRQPKHRDLTPYWRYLHSSGWVKNPSGSGKLNRRGR